MQVENTERSWGAVQQLLHWTIATMVIAQLIVGDIIWLSPEGSTPALTSYAHPTVGILIGLFMLGRLVWRETNKVPAVPEDIPTGLQALSQATHYAFYFLLICNPIIGYLLLGAFGGHSHFFTALLPNAIGKSAFYSSFYFWMHLAFGGAIGGLFLLHAGAALRHEFTLGDNVLRRMLGFLPMTAERQAVQDDPATVDRARAPRGALAARLSRSSR